MKVEVATMAAAPDCPRLSSFLGEPAIRRRNTVATCTRLGWSAIAAWSCCVTTSHNLLVLQKNAILKRKCLDRKDASPLCSLQMSRSLIHSAKVKSGCCSSFVSLKWAVRVCHAPQSASLIKSGCGLLVAGCTPSMGAAPSGEH